MVVTADPSTLRGIPEFFENEVGESIIARTESLATFRELGPPDLCHIDKLNTRGGPIKDVGSYHYVLGVDSSSSATLAAYLNSLIYTLGPPNTKNPLWKIKSGTYCCFNAFSRVDVRVEVRIPGGVESYVVDLRGDKHPITNPAIWQETFVSAILRSILDDNDEADGNDGQPLLGLRKLDPLPTRQVETRFLEAAKAEFWKGWQLGTDPEVQVATYFSNHLSNGIMKYFRESNRLEEGTKFFASLYDKDPEVGAALARAHLQNDEEIKAVQVLHDALKKHPLSYGLLMVQIDFLRGKKRLDLAVKLAKLAVTYAPSEYTTWAKLADIYIEMGDYESALLALNSCPMFTYCEKDAHRMPAPARTHLPLKPDAATLKPDEDPKKLAGSGSIFDENDPRENEVHPELQRLPALSLRGTFSKAYGLLIKIVSKVGWDELLRYRSLVFVMEEEYRIHRALAEEEEKMGTDGADEEGRVEGEDREGDAETGEGEPLGDVEREAESSEEVDFGRKESKPKDVDGVLNDLQASEGNNESSGSQNGIGKTSMDDDRGFDNVQLDDTNSPTKESKGKGKEKDTTSPTSTTTTATSKSKGLDIDELLKKTAGDKMGSVEGKRTLTRTPNPRPKYKPPTFAFRNKRLCEKWLDNLFMVLYNDLRLYTALKQEISQYRAGNTGATGTAANGTGPNQLLYRKTGAEWEIYGDLALRLDHPDDAKSAYKLCLDQKFSVKSLLKLLELASEAGDLKETLSTAVKLVTVLDRAFVEHTYPGPIGRCLFRLIGKHGLAKVQNGVISLNVPQRQYRLMTRYFEYAELFSVKGALW
ncbi:hypothetical protein HDV05_006946 [Chytridiales sp. JEL 0842]|nr:hypothetical protein HDV05_006946 [Chytridiales sp. JEL 0842]